MKTLNGFMARTHAILSIVLLEICMIIPLEIFQTTFWQLKSSVLLGIAGFFMLVGGALLPDLDNYVSKAGATLGPVGSIFTIFMQSTSSIVFNLYHGKNDARPMSQHRYLWHTPIIGIGIAALFYFGLPNGNYTIFTNISNSIQTGQMAYFLKTNATLVLFIILSFTTTLVGSGIIISKVGKVFPIPWFVKYVLPAGILVYVFTASYSDLRILGVCMGAGYLFHILEDFFADSGVPLIWPIPAFWCKKVWWRAHSIPFSVTTGGLVNTIIDYAALFVAIGLGIYIIIT